MAKINFLILILLGSFSAFSQVTISTRKANLIETELQRGEAYHKLSDVRANEIKILNAEIDKLDSVVFLDERIESAQDSVIYEQKKEITDYKDIIKKSGGKVKWYWIPISGVLGWLVAKASE